MADLTKLAKAIIEFGGENPEFKAMVEDTAKRLAGLTKNFRDTGSDLDKVAAGMSGAGKAASDSGKLIAGMSQSGRTELARLTEAGQQPVSVFKQMLGSLGPLQTAIAGAFTVTAVVNFAKGVGEFAGSMVDLSDETQISVTRLQAWNYELTGAGLTIQDFTDAVTQLQKRLADGDDSAVAAVQRLGLNVDALLAKAPDDAFIDIAEAVSHITNQGERTITMFDLFGRSGSRMLRLVSDELGATIREVEHSGVVIDEELIRKADDFDDAWAQALIRVRAGIVDLVGFWKSNTGLAPMGIDLPATLPNAPAAPGIFGANNGPTPVAGPTPEQMKALDEQAAKMKENIAVYEAHQKKLAELAEELSGAKAIAQIKDLQAAFLLLTPAQQANEQTIAAVNAQYEKLVGEVGVGVVPVLDQLYQAHGLVTDRARQLSNQLMLTTMDFGAAAQSAGDLTPQLLGTNAAIDAQTQQLAVVSYAYEGAALSQGTFQKSTISAWTEIDNLARSFEQLANIGGTSFGSLTRSIGTFVGALSTAHTSWGSLTSGFKSFTSGGGLSSMLSGFSSMVTGIGGIVGAAQAAFSAVKSLIGAFQSDETKYVNKPRGDFQKQFGGPNGGYDNLAIALTHAFEVLGDPEAGTKAEQLLIAMNAAKHEDEWHRAEDAILDVFNRAGRFDVQRFAAGGIATKPTLGIFGEAGDEALIPLDKLGSMAGYGHTEQTIVFQLDSRELTRTVVRGMPRELHLAGVGL